jgi:predicted nucleic acid-binding protein
VILVDTSAWIEFLRATGSPVHQQVRGLVTSTTPIATTEPVVMEVLAGARDGVHLRSLRQLLVGCDLLPVDGLAAWERAAAIWRRCRSAGETVRSLTDCLIADVALEAKVAVLHADRDFVAISHSTGLQLA